MNTLFVCQPSLLAADREASGGFTDLVPLTFKLCIVRAYGLMDGVLEALADQKHGAFPLATERMYLSLFILVIACQNLYACKVRNTIICNE